MASMLWDRKYIFETKSTRYRRVFLSGVALFIFSLILIVTFIIYIPIHARIQKKKAGDAFFQKSPDLIAVFTGDSGRISYATKILKNNPTAKLLISGVYQANSFETLLTKLSLKKSFKGKQESSSMTSHPFKEGHIESPSSQVDLDYKSKNTFENVLESLKYLDENTHLKKILIISSDYHILRIQLIFSHFIKKSNIRIYYDSVATDFRSWEALRKLLKESAKIFRTFFLLKVINKDMNQFVEDDIRASF